MKITNKAGLPEPFVKASESDYKPTPGRYSVTTLLKPVREIILSRRHSEEMEADASDMIWALFGTAVHKVLEENGGDVAEQRIEVPVGDFTVSGIIDYQDGDTVIDYKTCSVWKFRMGDVEDWRKQLSMYGWLLEQQGKHVDKGKIIAILRDHRKGEARRDPNYPNQVEVVEFQFPDYTETQEFIYNKLAEIHLYDKVPDDELPVCTAEERWARDGGYAVMKKGRKSALRVLKTEEEAQAWKETNGGDFIEVREPFNTKCEEYCNCAEWCSFYRRLKEKTE